MKFFLRLVTSFVLCNGVGFALCWLAATLLLLVMTIVPAIVSNMFTLEAAVMSNDVVKNQLIPGWGIFSSIFNSPDFSARLTGFIVTVLLWVALAILAYIVSFVKTTMVKNSKPIAVICGLSIFCYSVIAIIFMFNSDVYNSVFGIESGFWFYFVAVVLSILLLIINFGIIAYFWMNDENEKSVY